MVNYMIIVKLTSLLASVVHSRNMDSKNNYRMIKEENNSLFGYSIATHNTQEDHAMSLLVGAPGQRNFSGSVFRCNIFTAKCSDLTDIVSGVLRHGDEPPSHKWLGATVLSRNKIILVCAPNFGDNDAGKCYYTNETRSYDETFKKLPFVLNWKEEFFDMCVNGMSAALFTSNEKKAQQPFAIVTSGLSCFNETAKGLWTYKPDSFLAPVLLQHARTPETPGYALAAGKLKPGNASFLAASLGMFSKSAYRGKVSIHELDRITRNNNTAEYLNGQQDGEYFGASLAVHDLNGDGRDDLIVGAPIYSDYNSDVNYEIGAVYIFYQSDNGNFNTSDPLPQTAIIGKAISGRFGFSVAGIGDTNGDGFNDLAVGAPYENNGAVYIYHGSEHGVNTEPAQIIYGRDFSPPIKTFGWSFASGDYDGNSYNDIIVGAPLSDYVVYIPARPFVTVHITATFHPETIFVSGQQCSTTHEIDEQFSITEFIGIGRKKCAEIELCVSLSGNLKFSSQVPLILTSKLSVNGSLGDRSSPVSFTDSGNSNLQMKISISVDRECWRKELTIEKFLNRNLTVSAQLSILVDETSPGRLPELLPLVNNETSTSTASVLEINYREAPAKFKASVAHLPWWIYLACAIGALLIISTIVGVLAKLGFFKRKKPPNPEQDQQQQEKENEDNNEDNSEDNKVEVLYDVMQ